MLWLFKISYILMCFFKNQMQKNGQYNKVLVESIASAMVTAVPYAVKPEVHMTDDVRV